MAVKKMTVIPTKTLEGRDKKSGERIIHLAGVPVDMNSTEAASMIEKGLAVKGVDAIAPVAPTPDPAIATIDQIVTAIEGLKDEDFTSDGRPSVEALEAITGLEVTGKQRDKALDQYTKATKKQD
jgi:hypothetical protein